MIYWRPEFQELLMHEYTWKLPGEFFSNTSLRTNRPLTENTVAIDLFNGDRYAIFKLFQARPQMDRLFESMPDTVALASPIEAMPEDELAKLRQRANYMPDELSGPLGHVVFDI